MKSGVCNIMKLMKSKHMNKLVFILGKTGLDNLKRKLSDLILMVGSGGTATIKNNLNTPLPPQS